MGIFPKAFLKYSQASLKHLQQHRYNYYLLVKGSSPEPEHPPADKSGEKDFMESQQPEPPEAPPLEESPFKEPSAGGKSLDKPLSEELQPEGQSLKKPLHEERSLHEKTQEEQPEETTGDIL